MESFQTLGFKTEKDQTLFSKMPRSPKLQAKGVLPAQEEEADKHRMLWKHIQVFHIW